MKYFTPGRYLKLQDTSDDTAWLAASEEWERAVRDYWAEVRALLARLPKRVQRRTAGVRNYLRLGSLHDAAVTACWVEGDRSPQKLKLQVQPELPGERLVLLEYTLAREPTILRDQLPDEHVGDTLEWLYDEFSTLPDPGEESGLVFVHDILLSNGWELGIPFTRLEVKRPQTIWSTAHDRRLTSGAPLSRPA